MLVTFTSINLWDLNIIGACFCVCVNGREDRDDHLKVVNYFGVRMNKLKH